MKMSASLTAKLFHQTFLKRTPWHQVTCIAGLRCWTTDGWFKMGKIKNQYFTKNPIIIWENGIPKTEGVNDKQHPHAVQWRRPAHIRRSNPGPDASGDLGVFPDVTKDIDLTQPQMRFKGLKAFEEAPPEVKKLFTLEYGRMRDIKEILHEELRQEVADHQNDYDSNSVKIANLTLKIRYMQMWLAAHAKQGWRQGRGMFKLRRYVDQRRCQLGIFKILFLIFTYII